MKTTVVTENLIKLTDVFTSIGRVQVTNHFYLRFPLAQMATWDKAKDIESAQALTRLAPTLLAVGHGPAVPHPVPRMQTAVRQAGAVRLDIGQGDVPWTVLADPEGSEFCVLSPR